MGHQQGNLGRGSTATVPVLYVAFELANNTWKLACSDGKQLRHVTVTAGDLSQVQRAIIRAKRHFDMSYEIKVVSCYEAGRDDFWLHRYLHSCGIDNVVVDSASLEVNRRLRRAKTDRVDAGKLLSMLIRYHGGEKQLWRVVRVPSREDEDARHLHRELEALKRERTRYRNRIHGILIQQGLRVRNPSTKKFVKQLDLIRTWDGRELPPEMKKRLVGVHERLRLLLVNEHGIFLFAWVSILLTPARLGLVNTSKHVTESQDNGRKIDGQDEREQSAPKYRPRYD
jgi:transposase